MHGDVMIDKDCAKDVQEHALNAIAVLAEALTTIEKRCSGDEYEAIKRGVGLSIGTIETELLSVVYAAYPELDDLAHKPEKT